MSSASCFSPRKKFQVLVSASCFSIFGPEKNPGFVLVENAMGGAAATGALQAPSLASSSGQRPVIGCEWHERIACLMLIYGLILVNPGAIASNLGPIMGND